MGTLIKRQFFNFEEFTKKAKSASTKVNGDQLKAYKKLKEKKLNEGFSTTESEILDNVSAELGYDDFAEFIADNTGCLSVIMEWISKQKEFMDKLKNSDIKGLDTYLYIEKEEEEEEE